jgi:hypothetical protein
MKLVGPIADRLERRRRLGEERERRAPRLGAIEKAEAGRNLGRPRQDQKQQNQQEEQLSGAGIRYIQCLVLRNLAGDTYLVFCLGGMTMKQPETMKNDES